MRNLVISHNSLGLFTIHVVVGVGSASEAKGQRGSTHLLEHMLFKSKKDLPVEDLLLDLNGLGGTFNAATSKDWTMFYIKTVEDKWERSVELLHKIALEPYFVEKELRKERRVVVEELLQGKDNMAEVVPDAAYKAFLKKDNAYRYAVIGKMRDIVKTTPAQLQAYYDLHFSSPERILVCVNCPAKLRAQVKSKVTSVFAAQLGAFDLRLPAWTGVKNELIVKIVGDDTLSQNATCVMFESFAFADPRNTELEYIWDVLVGNLNSLLMMEIREKRGYVYSVSSFVDAYKDGGVTGVYFTSSHEDLGEIIGYLMKALRKLAEEGLTGGVLKYTRASYANRLKYKLTDFTFKNERAMWRHYYNVDTNDEAILKRVAKISNADLKAVASAVFHAHKMAVVSHGKYHSPRETEEKTRAAILRFASREPSKI